MALTSGRSERRRGVRAAICHLKPHPLDTRELAGERRGERRPSIRRREHREKPELAEVDAEHGLAVIGDESRGAQDR